MQITFETEDYEIADLLLTFRAWLDFVYDGKESLILIQHAGYLIDQLCEGLPELYEYICKYDGAEYQGGGFLALVDWTTKQREEVDRLSKEMGLE